MLALHARERMNERNAQHAERESADATRNGLSLLYCVQKLDNLPDNPRELMRIDQSSREEASSVVTGSHD